MKMINLHYKFTNCYLIEGNCGWIMVDTDFPGTLPQLFKSLKQQNIEMSDIKYLIITHFHPDHAGLVQNLKDFGIKFVIHENQVAFLEKLNAFFKKNPRFEYTTISGEENIVVSSLESRKLFKEWGLTGEIIPTPGHSNDSISVVIDDCCAFTGDLPEFSIIEAYNDKTLSESWKLIRDRNVQQIYPAHGNAYSIS